jgi:rhamnosyltransferase
LREKALIGQGTYSESATPTDSHVFVAAIIVTYHPELGRLQKLLRALIPQVDAVCVVDNGSAPELVALLDENFEHDVRLIPLGGNRGVAAAHNVGIKVSREIGASHVILFDQDSLPAADMVARLLDAETRQLAKGVRVGALGPRFHDPRDGMRYPFIRFQGWCIERVVRPDHDNCCRADYLITSGCLIRMECLDDVGGMSDPLFIDYVDIDWGLRARSKGYTNVGVFDAEMEHPLGEMPIKLFGGRVRVPLHQPLRHYYHFRNAIWLYKQSSAPLGWKFADAWRLCMKYGFYTLFAHPHLSHLRMMSLGVLHGLFNRMGRFDEAR